MNYRSRISIAAILFLIANSLYGHGGNPDFFRSIGKIYVVVAVVAVTFIGIAGFLIYLERKISTIEQEISSHK